MSAGSSAGRFDGLQRRRASSLHPAAVRPSVVVPDRVREARHAARLSMAELARQLGISVWKVEELESGRQDAGPYLGTIARATRRSPDWFVGPVEIDDTAEGPAAAVDNAEIAKVAGPSAGATERNLVLIAITLLITIRVFTEMLEILPRAANFIDVPIFAVLVAVAIAHRTGKPSRHVSVPSGIAFLFLVLCAVSMMTNLTRVDIAPALMFVYGFLGPVGIYAAVYRVWPAGSALWISKLLVGLAILQLLLAFGVQLPQYLATKNPDVVSGTFGENAYQLVFFLLIIIGLMAGVFTFEKHRLIAKFTPVILLAIVAVVFLAQYRALLITTALAVLLLSGLLGAHRARGALIAAFVTAGLLVTLAYVAQNVPALKFGSAIEQSREDPTLYLKKRLEPAKVIERMFGDEPRFTITGTGPGTYSSRGWQTFALAGGANSESNVAGSYVNVLTNGQAYHTDVSDKYVRPQLRTSEVVDGSFALTSPFSSYLSLLAELGVLGVTLVLALYIWAFVHSMRMTIVSIRTARERDPLPALLCATTVAFFVLLQMAVLENWFEVTRLTFLSWMLLAITTKEFAGRGLRT